MADKKRADAAKVFLDLLSRSPRWIAANRLRDRSAAVVSADGAITWHKLGGQGAQA